MFEQAQEIEALESIYPNEWRREVGCDVSYSMQITPDIKLYLKLDPSYPSEAPPTYQLLAPCLSKATKQSIGNAFEEIYLNNIGQPVLFQWIDKLKEIVYQSETPEEEVLDVSSVESNESIIDPEKYPIVHGPVITDRKSTFQGHVCEVHSEEDVKSVLSLLLGNKKIAQAKHNILAYRLEKPSGVVSKDCDDDGEAAAGGRLLHLLDILQVKNVVVIVTRWYGGIHLGPDRFKHINNAARQVLKDAGFIK